jgi:hypothetical protein
MVKRSRLQSQEGAEPFQLLDDGAAGLGFPLPDPFKKGFTAQGFARGAFLHELFLDDVLRGNAGMVGARHPQHIAALHAAPANQDVLKRIVQCVADVQGAGHIRGRDDNAIGRPRVFRGGLEVPAADPFLVPAVFDGFRFIGLIELRCHDAPFVKK